MTKAVRNMFALLGTGVLVALLAGALGASPAAAEEKPGLECLQELTPLGVAFKGEGSSLQKLAQQNVWIPGFTVNAEGCEGNRGDKAKPKIEYTSNGSGAGLAAFGVGKTEKCNTHRDIFIGTDDAPSKAQIEEINQQCLLEKGKAGQVVVVPVEQAAIAIVVNYPENCKLTENHITNADLEAVFRNKITLWEEISTHEGTECKVLIKRAVRKEGSGTTYQFKHYLFEIFAGVVLGGKTWHELQEEPTANTEWPGNDLLRGAGGGGLVKEVEANKGSIGYANLADARVGFPGGVRWLAVQNEKTTLFVYPGTGAAEPEKETRKANCAKTSYPKAPLGDKADADWSQIYGGSPTLNTNYPICTLTWDVALHNYFAADYAEGETGTEIEKEEKAHVYGQTAFDYFHYLTATKGGQEEINKEHDYAELPEASQTIRKSAQEVVKLIN